ncbi:hypothetical protein C8R47DRAFT_1067557 [Mycena vitilis]|nr:hypothetical protein C8R47DRAFT_1067557 [Mycena vitilis]
MRPRVPVADLGIHHGRINELEMTERAIALPSPPGLLLQLGKPPRCSNQSGQSQGLQSEPRATTTVFEHIKLTLASIWHPKVSDKPLRGGACKLNENIYGFNRLKRLKMETVGALVVPVEDGGDITVMSDVYGNHPPLPPRDIGGVGHHPNHSWGLRKIKLWSPTAHIFCAGRDLASRHRQKWTAFNPGTVCNLICYAHGECHPAHDSAAMNLSHALFLRKTIFQACLSASGTFGNTVMLPPNAILLNIQWNFINIQQALLALGRHTLRDEKAMAANFANITSDIPTYVDQDTRIFLDILIDSLEDIKERFADHKRKRKAAPFAPASAPQAFASRPRLIYQQMQFVEPVGPLTRALSRAPSVAPASHADKMVLFSELRESPPVLRPQGLNFPSDAAFVPVASSKVQSLPNPLAIFEEIDMPASDGILEPAATFEVGGSLPPPSEDSDMPLIDPVVQPAMEHKEDQPLKRVNPDLTGSLPPPSEDSDMPLIDPVVQPAMEHKGDQPLKHVNPDLTLQPVNNHEQLSPLSPSPSEGAMDVEGDADTLPVSEDPVLRRSVREKKPLPVASGIPDTASSKKNKRKASGTPSSAQKRAKASSDKSDEEKPDFEAQTEGEQEPEDGSDDDEPELYGLDSEWVSPTNNKRWIDDVQDINQASIKACFPNSIWDRSTTAATITGVLPDGITERSFNYLSHEVSIFFAERFEQERPEYKLIFDINTSMANVSEWDLMSDLERVKLWSTGVDLFILGMTSIPQTGNIRGQMTKNHRMDAPVQVQVQGLQIIPDEDSNASADYTKSIGTTTLREVLNHGERPDGLVLNALNLPSGHMAHWNPLLGTGFDLEHIAYRQTNGIEGFVYKDPAYKEMYWQLLGLAHAFSLLHLDISATWVFVWGPGESSGSEDVLELARMLLYRFQLATLATPTPLTTGSRTRPAQRPVTTRSLCFPPVRVSWRTLISLLLKTRLQQPGREHAVISTNTGDNASPSIDRTATWTIGGYFFCATSIRPAMCMTLHMVMFQHLLTNADHVAMWQTFIRVNMFWLHVTAGRPPEDLRALEAYCPDLSNAEGWMDIIYLSCMIVLLPALDVRNYARSGPSEAALEDAAEADIVRAYYKTWRHWLATKYTCSYAGEHTNWDMEWEADVFMEYHLQQSTKYPDVAVFKTFTPEALTLRMCDALGAYDKKILKQFKSKKAGVKLSEEDATKFFVFDASKLTVWLLEFRRMAAYTGLRNAQGRRFLVARGCPKFDERWGQVKGKGFVGWTGNLCQQDGNKLAGGLDIDIGKTFNTYRMDMVWTDNIARGWTILEPQLPNMVDWMEDDVRWRNRVHPNAKIDRIVIPADNNSTRQLIRKQEIRGSRTVDAHALPVPL